MGAQQRLTDLWYREPDRASLLQPLAWLYGAVVRLRRAAYGSGLIVTERAGCPVVVIGNLTVGGTGKTPLTIWLARELVGRGLRVGILSRGYGRRERAPREVLVGSDWREVGDEPLLLARHSACPTFVAADRVAGARALTARGVQVILADDGLQHLRLGRACEIVVVDGARGFGNGRLLPAGPLREPLAALARADVVVTNGAATHGSLARPPPGPGPLTMSLVAGEAVRARRRRCPAPAAGLPRAARARGRRDRQSAALLCHAARPGTRARGASLSGPSSSERAGTRFRRSAAGAHDGEGCRKMRRLCRCAALVRTGRGAARRRRCRGAARARAETHP